MLWHLLDFYSFCAKFILGLPSKDFQTLPFKPLAFLLANLTYTSFRPLPLIAFHFLLSINLVFLVLICIHQFLALPSERTLSFQTYSYFYIPLHSCCFCHSQYENIPFHHGSIKKFAFMNILPSVWVTVQLYFMLLAELHSFLASKLVESYVQI